MKKIIILIELFFLILIFFWFINLNYLKKDFEVDFLNTGQGNLTLVKYQNQLILIDLGNEDIGLKNLKENLNFFDKEIDLVILTHFDIDHVGNIFKLDKNYLIDRVVSSSSTNLGLVKKEVLEELRQKSIPYFELKAGDELIFDPNFKIKIFYPFKGLEKQKDNFSSLVLQLNYQGRKILITGDLPQEVEKYLVKIYGQKLKSDILVAGHHGSKTSNSQEFLMTIKPKWIIFSVGKDNKYHHPNEEVVKRVKKDGIKILRTDEDGNIYFWVENGKWFEKVELKENGKIYEGLF